LLIEKIKNPCRRMRIAPGDRGIFLTIFEEAKTPPRMKTGAPRQTEESRKSGLPDGFVGSPPSAFSEDKFLPPEYRFLRTG